MQRRIAVSHARGIAAEAILERLAESGILPQPPVLLERAANIGGRIRFAGQGLGLQDQTTFDLSSCALLLMPEADPELEAAALAQGCLLVSHALAGDTPALFVGAARDEPEIAYNETRLRLAGPELCSLLPVLQALVELRPLERLSATLMRSAEFYGKAGVDELAAQTINLLNARDVVPGVYPQQIAFNLLPETVDARLADDLRANLGNISYSGGLQSLNLPVFHGFAAAVQLHFSADLDPVECERRLSALPGVTVKKGVVSPISDCNQSFSCVISHLEQAPEQPASLHFWMMTDPMRYGLANNYVNVAEFLLKSFL